MAFNYYLKIDGVKGESTFKGEEGSIEIQSYSTGVSQPGTSFAGSGASGGVATFHDMTVTSYLGSHSANIGLRVANGEHFTTPLVLSCYKMGTENMKYLEIKLTDAMIAGYSVSGGGEVPSEAISINFAKYEQQYFRQDEKGAPVNAGNWGWDTKTNTKVA